MVAMQLGLRMTEFRSRMNRAAAPRWVPWSSLWRGALLAFCIVLAFSTQLLFQLDLYANWPLPDILLGWLDHLVDQLIVGGCIFAAIALARLLPMKAGVATHGWVLVSIALG